MEKEQLFASEKTDTEKKAEAIRIIMDRANHLFEMLEASHGSLFESFWNSPDITPEEILESLGSKAWMLFYASSELQKIMKKLNPSYQELIPKKTAIVYETGAVTLEEKV